MNIKYKVIIVSIDEKSLGNGGCLNSFKKGPHINSNKIEEKNEKFKMKNEQYYYITFYLVCK